MKRVPEAVTRRSRVEETMRDVGGARSVLEIAGLVEVDQATAKYHVLVLEQEGRLWRIAGVDDAFYEAGV